MDTKARILISNDDGITAPGLCAIARELMKVGRYDVRICAPEREQSAMSHAITVRQPLYAEVMEMPGDLVSLKACKVSGTPADCVRLALNVSLFGDNWKPDLVLSGINRGHNSGTVAAAMESLVFGYARKREIQKCLQTRRYPAMALSLNHPTTYPSHGDVWPFDIAAAEAIPIIDEFLLRLAAKEVPRNLVINVNFPNVTNRSDIKGVKATKQGVSRFTETFEEQTASSGPRRCFILAGQMTLLDKEELYDTFAMDNGWVSVTPLSLFMMASDDKNGVSLESLQKWPIFKNR